MGRIDDAKTLTEIVKNLGVLLFYGAVAVGFFIYGIPFIRTELKDKKGELEETNIFGNKIKWQDVSNKLNAGNQTKGASDVQVGAISKPLAIALDTVLDKTEKTFWVYLGQYIPKKSSWRIKTFNFDQIPTPQSTITATVDVFKRDNEPTKISEDNWTSGKIVGVVSARSNVTVIKVDKIEDDNYWALVK